MYFMLYYYYAFMLLIPKQKRNKTEVINPGSPRKWPLKTDEILVLLHIFKGKETIRTTALFKLNKHVAGF